MSERSTVEEGVIRCLGEQGNFYVRPQSWKAMIRFQYTDERFPSTITLGFCDTRDAAWDLINRMRDTIDVQSTVISDDRALKSGE